MPSQRPPSTMEPGPGAAAGLGELLEAQRLTTPSDPYTQALTRLLGRTQDGPFPTWLPAPLPANPRLGEGRLSPRALLLLSRMLDVHRGDVVRLEGTPLALLACLLLELPSPLRPSKVHLHTPHPAATRQTLESAGHDDDRIEVQTIPTIPTIPSAIQTDAQADTRRDRPADRLLVWNAASSGPRRPAGDGLAITVHLRTSVPAVHQVVVSDDMSAHLDLSRHIPRLSPPRSTRSSGMKAENVPLRRLFAAERHQLLAWNENFEGRLGRLVTDSVERLFSHGPLDTDHARDRRTRFLFHLGYLEQLTATRSGALALYQASLRERPSAEAWTFVGWIHAQQGSMDQAIEACQQAIATDPTLGNPYNDTGAYLFALGHNDEAKPWFHQALTAPRYVAPHYPYTNLARIHLQEGDLQAARTAAEQALESRKDYAPARRLMRQIETRSDGPEQ